MDAEIAPRWLDRLGRAWRDRDPEAVADLFTVDARYHSEPFRLPLLGRAEIAAYWAAAVNKQSGIKVSFGVPLVDGDRVAVEWWSTLNEGGRPATEAGGLFLRFEHERCAVLREYWNLTPGVAATPKGWGR